MKIAPTKEYGFQKKPNLILTLQEDVEETYTLDKTNSVSWELSTRPGTAGAATYKFQCRILTGDETPRQMMRWRQDVLKVCIGLHVSTLATRQPIMETCMRAGPKAVFIGAIAAQAKVAYLTALNVAKQADQAAGNTTASDAVIANGEDHYMDNDMLDGALKLVISNYLPRKVLARVKRSMRRDMRKPVDMKIRNYYQNLIRMNDEELPNLPPFELGNKLSEDELLDIILFGTPRSWQNEMERQNFDPIEAGIHGTVDFMEGIEASEPSSEVSKPKAKTSPNKKKKADDKKPPHYCEQHGANYTHDTKDCRFLHNKKSGSGSKSGNKTWSRKANEASSNSKKELAALIGKTVHKAVKKQLASVDKKRKSDDEGDCYLVDALTKDLDGFNYEDMANLKIDDDSQSVGSETSC